jgi:hypothetical protein
VPQSWGQLLPVTMPPLYLRKPPWFRDPWYQRPPALALDMRRGPWYRSAGWRPA